MVSIGMNRKRVQVGLAIGANYGMIIRKEPRVPAEDRSQAQACLADSAARHHQKAVAVALEATGMHKRGIMFEERNLKNSGGNLVGKRFQRMDVQPATLLEQRLERKVRVTQVAAGSPAVRSVAEKHVSARPPAVHKYLVVLLFDELLGRRDAAITVAKPGSPLEIRGLADEAE